MNHHCYIVVYVNQLNLSRLSPSCSHIDIVDFYNTIINNSGKGNCIVIFV